MKARVRAVTLALLSCSSIDPCYNLHMGAGKGKSRRVNSSWGSSITQPEDDDLHIFEEGREAVQAHRHINPDYSDGGWVADTAEVASTAYIGKNAQVYNFARVIDHASVDDEAEVYGNAHISGNARVYGNATATGNVQVRDDAQVYGNARLHNQVQVSGNARISEGVHGGDTIIKGADDPVPASDFDLAKVSF